MPECRVDDMEQLAYFVTKTFEFNNTSNRVFEIINMTTKFESSEKMMSEKCDKDESMDEDESVDVDITDNASDNGSVEGRNEEIDLSVSSKKCDKSSEKPSTILIEESCKSQDIQDTNDPLPLVKKVNRLVTRNWLIGDCPNFKKKAVAEFCSNSENQENRHSEVNIIRVEDLIRDKSDNKSKSSFSGGNFGNKMPSNELLLKQIREINNLSPLSSSNNAGDMKKEIVDDERIKSGENFHTLFVLPSFFVREFKSFFLPSSNKNTLDSRHSGN